MKRVNGRPPDTQETTRGPPSTTSNYGSVNLFSLLLYISSSRHHNSSSSSRAMPRGHHESFEDGEADTGDSLDIKPPQPGRMVYQEKRKKADRHHQREGRDDRRDKHKQHASARDHHKSGRRDTEPEGQHYGQQNYHHRDARYEDEMRRTHDQSRDPHYSSRPTNKIRDYSSPIAHPRIEADDQQVDRLRKEEDLRSRLLIKRSQMEGGDEKRKGRREMEEIDSRGFKHDRREERNSRSSSSAKESGPKFGGKQPQIMETIDSPEAPHYYSEERIKHSRKGGDRRGSPDDKELLARRAKLLEAEREMSQRKEVARRELEERRERRRGRNDGDSRDRSESPVVDRKRSKKEEGTKKEQRKPKPVDEEVVSLSDQTESSEEDGEASPDTAEDDGESGSASPSGSGSDDDDDAEDSNESDSSEGTDETKSDVDVPCSPLSIGDLAKDHSQSRHTSRSRSTSKSRSRSRSRSHSGSSVDRDGNSRSPRRRGRYSDHEEPITSDEEDEGRNRNSRRQSRDSDVEMAAVVKEEKPAISEEELKRLREEEEKLARIAALPNYYPALQVKVFLV